MLVLKEWHKHERQEKAVANCKGKNSKSYSAFSSLTPICYPFY